MVPSPSLLRTNVAPVLKLLSFDRAEGELWGQTGIFPLNYVQML
jgi:hypothetical protein